jgi:site-specific DNA-methyltransferase (adenine-specific)
MTYQILKGNSLDLLPTLADNSIDAIVTDPPYELGFMGKTWDNSGIAYSIELWQQCLRVLKPGGHLLAFSGSRTYHRMVVSIEDAGFEIRDMISWISNKTFPKSLNIGKAIDKAAGVEREVTGFRKSVYTAKWTSMNQSLENHVDENGYAQVPLTEPATDQAKKWNGWGTGLKPTVEPIVMARKRVEGTVANNVLTYGTGGLNIDASRIGTDMSEFFSKTGNPRSGKGHLRSYGATGDFGGDGANPPSQQGRWPANLILDEQAAELVDEQSDGASRFFYVAKASKRDRNEGLEELPAIMARNYAQDQTTLDTMPFGKLPKQNFHPTVKPTQLMQYLVKLITPPGGTVLDPFTGSGSTGKAAILEGFDFIGIELTEDYWPIIEGRLKHAEAKVAERIKETSDQEQEKLF